MRTYVNILWSWLFAYAGIAWSWLFRRPILGQAINQLNNDKSSIDDEPVVPQPYPLQRESPRLFALIVGISRYASAEMDNLKGPVADAKAMKKYLETHLGVPEDQIRDMYNSEATREAMIQGIKDLELDSRIERGDPILIYYAGHGGEKEKAKGWEANGPKIQMILPHDYLIKKNKQMVFPIPDRTINAMLEQLAIEKGDNITVIFDCCHSGSGTRKPGSNRQSRGVEVTMDIPANLDEDILRGSRGGEVPEGFRHSGLRSHVLLAACNQNEKAMEENGRGVFTVALINALVATGAGKVTYSGLFERLPSLPQQTPQCEGVLKGRILFDSKAPALGASFYRVRVDGSVYTLKAGAAHGITDGAEFAIYKQPDDFYADRSLGSLVVRSVNLFSSTLAAPSDTTSTQGASMVLDGDVFALQTRAGLEEDLRLHIAGSLLLDIVKKDLSRESRRKASNRRRFALVEPETARLMISLEKDHAVFDTLNPLVNEFGLRRMPFRVMPDMVPSVIQAAAHFDWHLRRTAPPQAGFQNAVRLEFTKVVKIKERIQTEGPNLNIDGNIDIVVDKSMYGMKLINDSKVELYPYLFCFDCSNLSIEFYYDSATTREAKGNAPLQPNGSITIGYGAGGWSPWQYSLRQPKKFEEGRILQEKQDVDVGFLKLFISTKPLDLSHMEQHSPFLPPYKLGYRGGKRQPFEAIENWDTTLITLIQRKEIPKESTINDVETT